MYTIRIKTLMSHAPHQSHPAVTLSVRVPAEARDQLEQLAEATGRTKSFLAAEALEHYLSIQNWQIKMIKQSMKKADSKKAKFTSHQEVSDWLSTWGNKNEENPPK